MNGRKEREGKIWRVGDIFFCILKSMSEQMCEREREREGRWGGGGGRGGGGGGMGDEGGRE